MNYVTGVAATYTAFWLGPNFNNLQTTAGENHNEYEMPFHRKTDNYNQQ